MKKVFLGLMVLVTSLVLVACGGGDRGGTQANKLVEWYELSPDAVFDTNTPVTIHFWHRMGAASQQLVQKWIGEFKEIYPNITVVETKVGTDYEALREKIALSIPAGTTPDIAESYPDHIARYAQAKAPLALNNFISHPVYGMSEADQADFLEGLWNEGKSYDTAGTILSLPFTKSSEAFFYNAGYFAEKGYEVPTTWDEVFEIAEKIKAEEPDAYPFGYDSEDNLFITGAAQYDAPYTGYNAETGRGEVLFNNDKTKEMVSYFKDKVDRGLMITRSLNADAYTSDIFKTGKKLYMYVGSTGGARYAYESMTPEVFDNGNFKAGVAPLPAFDANNRKQIQQGPNINLFIKDSEQQMIAAWLFAKYMTSAEKTAEFALPSGYAPIRKSAYETDTWKNYVATIVENPTTMAQAQAKIVKEAIEIFRNNEDIFFTSAVFNLSSKTRTEVGSLIAKVFAYKQSSEDDLKNYMDTQFQDSYDFITN